MGTLVAPELPGALSTLTDEERRALSVLALAQRNRHATSEEAWLRAWAAAMNDLLMATSDSQRQINDDREQFDRMIGRSYPPRS